MASDYIKIRSLLEHPNKENKELGFQLLKGAGFPETIEPWILSLLRKQPTWFWEGLEMGWTKQLAPFIKSIKIILKPQQILPKELFELHSLKRLYLKYEGDLLLPNIPQHFGQLQNLTELRLAGNKHNNSGLNKVPTSILKIPNLTTLHLETNNIKSLPLALAKKPSLKNLYLDRNKLQEWPENLSAFSQLDFLSLKHNKLTQIPDSIRKMTSLWALNLSYNKLTTLPFQSLPKLYYLSIKKNPLAKSIKDLAKLPILLES